MDSVQTQVWLLIDEAADRARISRATLERELSAGRGPRACRVGRRKLVFHVNDVDAWIRARAVGGAA